MTTRPRTRLSIVASTAALVFAVPFALRADHWWNGALHWPQGPTATVVLGDNVSTGFQSYFEGAIDLWNTPIGVGAQNVFVTPANGGTSAKSCKPTTGRVEVCTAKYGDNGWLGIAQAWFINNEDHLHLTQATVKANETYFDTPYYDTPAWRGAVMCHEIGHTLGLGHRDEDFSTSVGSCMDYADPPTPVPDAHDFEQLEYIYALFFDPPDYHPTTTSGGGGGGGGGRGRGSLRESPGDAAAWGRLVAERRGESIFAADLGFGRRVVTFVLWAN